MYHLALAATLLLPLSTMPGDSPAHAASMSVCASPAPLLGEPSPEVIGYVVVFREGTHVRRTLARLRRTYRFKPEHVFRDGPPGFSAQLSDAALAGIRCEPEVEYVEHEGIFTVG